MSGYGAALGPISRESPYHFIAKPFGLDALSALVSRVLGES
jgi:hypothetical protein